MRPNTIDDILFRIVLCEPSALQTGCWVCVDAIARSTSGPYSSTVVPELPAMEVLGRLEALR